MPQGRLFQLTIRRTEPAGYNTADCKTVGVGDDGLLYILKRVSDGHPLIPASEWICSQLAEHIGLPVSPSHIARLPGGSELAFASREEGGVIDYARTLDLLKSHDMLKLHAPMLSRWYAFDLFTHNLDRHLGNFLFRESRLGHVLIGIDFSRALLAEGWPTHRPPLPACNTRHVQKALHQHAPYPTRDAFTVIERLQQVSDDWLGETIERIPAEWLDGKVRPQLRRWWRGSRQKRLHLLRRHLSSGRYLHVLADSRGARSP